MTNYDDSLDFDEVDFFGLHCKDLETAGLTSGATESAGKASIGFEAAAMAADGASRDDGGAQEQAARETGKRDLSATRQGQQTAKQPKLLPNLASVAQRVRQREEQADRPPEANAALEAGLQSSQRVAAISGPQEAEDGKPPRQHSVTPSLLNLSSLPPSSSSGSASIR